MGRIKVNPDAKQPTFVAVQPGEYRMKFQRLEEKSLGQSEKGNWWTRLRLVHLAPSENLISLATGQPLRKDELPSSISAVFMLTEDRQGQVRQALESAGLQWPTDAPEFESEEQYGLWIQQSLENREVVVRLKTRQYEGEWQNEVSRYITPTL